MLYEVFQTSHVKSPFGRIEKILYCKQAVDCQPNSLYKFSKLPIIHGGTGNADPHKT